MKHVCTQTLPGPPTGQTQRRLRGHGWRSGTAAAWGWPSGLLVSRVEHVKCAIPLGLGQ